MMVVFPLKCRIVRKPEFLCIAHGEAGIRLRRLQMASLASKLWLSGWTPVRGRFLLRRGLATFWRKIAGRNRVGFVA